MNTTELFLIAMLIVFTLAVIGSLNSIVWWAVMLFVWIAGIELDLSQAWQHKRESSITAGLALGMPLLLGCAAAAAMRATPGWVGARALTWQFVLGVGMSCAVTALPILILFMEKLDILRLPIGQRILRYAAWRRDHGPGLHHRLQGLPVEQPHRRRWPGFWQLGGRRRQHPA